MPFAPRQHRASGESAKKKNDHRRHSASDRGYDNRWAKYWPEELSRQVTEEANPWCRYCDKNEAQMLDHAIPPTRKYSVGSEAYMEAFWDERMFVPACRRCNSLKQDKLPHELDEPIKSRLIRVLKARGIQC
jgi:5-methylcytosine-specific restriction endonuclease McrA